MLGRLASMIPVPREHDFGIDFYCLPRRAAGPRSETVTEICSIQVKGSGADGLTFGGLGKAGDWQRLQLEWLRSLSHPLYFAVVDDQFRRVDLYSAPGACRFSGKRPFRSGLIAA